MNKYIITLIFVLFTCISCTEDPSIDPTIMPPATTEGAGTFGCLIDGWVYTAGRYGKPDARYFTGDEEEKEYIAITARTDQEEYITFRIISPSETDAPIYTNAQYISKDKETTLPDGVVHLTRFDKDKKIVSGTFEGGNIKEGRFDIVFE